MARLFHLTNYIVSYFWSYQDETQLVSEGVTPKKAKIRITRHHNSHQLSKICRCNHISITCGWELWGHMTGYHRMRGPSSAWATGNNYGPILKFRTVPA